MSPTDVREALVKLMGGGALEPMVVLARVTAVNAEAGTFEADPLDGDAPIVAGRLMPVAGMLGGLVLVPEVGATVAVLRIGRTNTEYLLLAASSVLEVRVATGTLVHRGGANGGAVLVGPLTEALNQIEAKLDAFIAAYNAHSHASSGAAPPAAPVSPLGTQTAKATLENTQLLH